MQLGNEVDTTLVDEGTCEISFKDSLSSTESCLQLESRLHRVAEEPDLKVLVLTDMIHVGLDARPGRTAEGSRRRLVELLVRFPVPTLAILESDATGSALAMAIGCDLLVAARDGRYGFVSPWGGATSLMGATGLLPTLVGHGFAMELLLAGKCYSGRELDRRGLFNVVLPSSEVRSFALDLAARIVECPRHVVQMLKSSLALPRQHALWKGLYDEDLIARASCSS